MSLLAEIKNRFRPVLAEYGDDVEQLLTLVKPSQDPKFGDYQLNCAMPLGKKQGRAPREVADEIVANSLGVLPKLSRSVSASGYACRIMSMISKEAPY